MHDEECDAHQEHLDEGRRPGERSYDEQECAGDFREDGKRETGAAAEANRIGKLASRLREIDELAPAVQKQERQAKPESQREQTGVGAVRKEIKLEEFADVHGFIFVSVFKLVERCSLGCRDYFEVLKITFCSNIHPKTDTTGHLFPFHFIHNQRRLFLPIEIKGCLAS